MTGYVKNFDDKVTMSFNINISHKKFIKEYDQIWKKIEKLLKIKFYSKPVYGDDEKYIKTKTHTHTHKKKMVIVLLQILIIKKL